MGTIRDKMRDDLDLRGFCFDDKEGVPAARSELRRLLSPPADGAREREVREFLLYLANEKKTGSATWHMYVAAIKFLYATTLARPEEAAAEALSAPTTDRQRLMFGRIQSLATMTSQQVRASLHFVNAQVNSLTAHMEERRKATTR